MNLYKKCTAKPYSVLFIDTTLALDNSSRFRNNLLERIKKLKYDINWEAAKISALSSSKIDKYELLTGEEILPSAQSRIIEQVYIFSSC